MDGYHPAGAHPDLCAKATLEFMAKQAGSAGAEMASRPTPTQT